LFFNSGDQFMALKAKNGKQLWSARTFAPKGRVAGNSAAPIALDGTIYIGGLSVTAYNEKTGAFKWSQHVDATSSQVAYGDGGIYAGGPSQYYKFAADGSLLWRNSGCCSGGGGIAVNYFRKRVYLVDWAEGNFALRSDNGIAAGSFPGNTPPTFFSSGKQSFELVISNGKLYCLNTRKGDVAWTFSNKNLSGQPIVINGQPVVAAGNSFYMLDGATGAQLWANNMGAQITNLNAGDGVLAVETGTKVTAYVPQ
jgi:outer membrane protein assembly factor BamB